MVDQPSGPTWGAPPPPPPPPFPPGGAWTGAVPSPFRKLGGLATAMTVLLVLAGALAAVLIPLALHERQVVDDATHFGVFFVGADVRDAVDAVNGVAGFYFVVFLAIAVLWMIWMWRAANNTVLLRRFKPRFGPGFAIGGWFIPIAFWVIPGMHMYDIDRGSGPPAYPGARPKGSGRIVIWWVLFVLGWAGSGFGQATFTRGFRYDATSFEVRNTLFVVAMLATVVAAGLAIAVVRSVTRAQHEAWDAMLAGAASDAAGGPVAPGPWPGSPVAPGPWSSSVPPAPTVPPVVDATPASWPGRVPEDPPPADDVRWSPPPRPDPFRSDPPRPDAPPSEAPPPRSDP